MFIVIHIIHMQIELGWVETFYKLCVMALGGPEAVMPNYTSDLKIQLDNLNKK